MRGKKKEKERKKSAACSALGAAASRSWLSLCSFSVDRWPSVVFLCKHAPSLAPLAAPPGGQDLPPSLPCGGDDAGQARGRRKQHADGAGARPASEGCIVSKDRALESFGGRCWRHTRRTAQRQGRLPRCRRKRTCKADRRAQQYAAPLGVRRMSSFVFSLSRCMPSSLSPSCARLTVRKGQLLVLARSLFRSFSRDGA